MNRCEPHELGRLSERGGGRARCIALDTRTGTYVAVAAGCAALTVGLHAPLRRYLQRKSKKCKVKATLS
eukprot:scaffold70910_cov69-Phaeocystis_antarctica.AAC.8